MASTWWHIFFQRLCPRCWKFLLTTKQVGEAFLLKLLFLIKPLQLPCPTIPCSSDQTFNPVAMPSIPRTPCSSNSIPDNVFNAVNLFTSLLRDFNVAVSVRSVPCLFASVPTNSSSSISNFATTILCVHQDLGFWLAKKFISSKSEGRLFQLSSSTVAARGPCLDRYSCATDVGIAGRAMRSKYRLSSAFV